MRIPTPDGERRPPSTVQLGTLRSRTRGPFVKELSGKVAVVTGAAGGIGKALSLACARAGMDVVLADLNEAGSRDVARSVQALGRRALSVPTDVCDGASVERLLERTVRELGSCSLAINNAGVFRAAPLIETSAEQYRRVIDLNIGGVVNGCRVFGDHFVRQGHGHIVNTASAAGIFPAPGMSAYSLTKYGVVGYSLQLRWELAVHGVGVTAVCPGAVRTDILTRDGVNVRADAIEKLMRGVPGTDKLARKVLKAVRRDRAMVYYGADAYVMALLRILPMWMVDPLGKLIARKALEVVRDSTALPPERASADPGGPVRAGESGSAAG